jgi:hypothetical protein
VCEIKNQRVVLKNQQVVLELGQPCKLGLAKMEKIPGATKPPGIFLPTAP